MQRKAKRKVLAAGVISVTAGAGLALAGIAHADTVKTYTVYVNDQVAGTLTLSGADYIVTSPSKGATFTTTAGDVIEGGIYLNYIFWSNNGCYWQAVPISDRNVIHDWIHPYLYDAWCNGVKVGSGRLA